MSQPVVTRITKWPFLVSDALLLGVAYFVYFQSRLPMDAWSMLLVVVCVIAGAALCILPFVLEYRLAARLAETTALTTALEQMRNLEQVATQISAATARWQNVQEESEKVCGAAKGIADRMTAEAQAFTEFMQKANDTEKATLRLELDKMRRAESDWLQVAVRMLDHVYALNTGAARSGQPKLIEQLGNFQIACRDAARRVGLTPFVANPSDRFDAERHQVLDGDGKPAADSTIAETIATGYTFQGRLLRPALVRLNGNGAPMPAEAIASAETAGA
jgi:molecular chaperone GrpE (heat shock protein)